MQSSHPFLSPLCQSQSPPHCPRQSSTLASFQQISLPFSGEPYGSLSDLYEYDYGEGASENEIGVGKSTPQFLTQPQQLVSYTCTQFEMPIGQVKIIDEQRCEDDKTCCPLNMSSDGEHIAGSELVRAHY